MFSLQAGLYRLSSGVREYDRIVLSLKYDPVSFVNPCHMDCYGWYIENFRNSLYNLMMYVVFFVWFNTD